MSSGATRPVLSGALLAQLEEWLPANDDPERPQMQLCTVDGAGRPDARTVLLSAWDERGFEFHTDSASRKAAQLRDRTSVALVVLWPGFSRQLTVQGDAAPIDTVAAHRAFESRSPYLRQLAWQNTAEMAALDRPARAAAWAEFGRSHDVGAIEPPPTWAGFRVLPTRVTFWRSDPDGPSHRVEHRRGEHGWTVQHLAG